jgi:tetratricopeptide (TPR) repeat protein
MMNMRTKKAISGVALICWLVALWLSPSFGAQAQSAEDSRLRELAREAGQALGERRYADAERIYEKLRQLSPNTAEIHAQLGLAYFQQGKFAQAAPAFQQALKLKPALPNLDLLLAMAQSELGRYKEALPALRKGFTRTTDPVLKRSAGLQLQRAYTGLREDDNAVEIALEMARSFPKDPEVLYHAARLFGNFAYLSTVRLAEAAPDSVWRHLAAGEASESQGRAEAAIEAYRAVLALDRNRPGVHYRLGRALLLRARGNTSDTSSEGEALTEFEEELRIDSTNANAAYEAAELHRKSARFAQAAALFARAAGHDPDFEEALIGWGRALLGQGQAEAALAPLKRAAALDATNEVAWFQLAQAHRALGNAADQRNALAEFQRRRDAKTRRAEAPPRREVTQQTLDAKPNP